MAILLQREQPQEQQQEEHQQEEEQQEEQQEQEQEQEEQEQDEEDVQEDVQDDGDADSDVDSHSDENGLHRAGKEHRAAIVDWICTASAVGSVGVLLAAAWGVDGLSKPLVTIAASGAVAIVAAAFVR
jgi:hypothetical protein